MVAEATMIILDNSEWMRNGDYRPTRFEAQSEAVSIIFSAKTNANPENTVGVMTMAGKTPEVLVTLTSELQKIMAAMPTVKITGNANIASGIQVAQLALKHRQNKNQRQRIIVFIGSPLGVDEKALVKLGKKMKKNNVAIDVISYGEDTDNSTPLENFIQAVNSSDNCRLLTVPRGPRLLTDVLISSPILAGEDGSAPAGFASSSSGGGFEFGVDPNLDPELAMALRMSLEEEQKRQEEEAAKAGGEGSSAAAGSGSGQGKNAEDAGAAGTQSRSGTTGTSGGTEPGSSDTAMLGDEDEQLQRALQLSMEQGGQAMDVDDTTPSKTDDKADKKDSSK